MRVLCGIVLVFGMIYAIVSGLSSLRYEKNIIGKIALFVVYFGAIIWIAKIFIL